MNNSIGTNEEINPNWHYPIEILFDHKMYETLVKFTIKNQFGDIRDAILHLLNVGLHYANNENPNKQP